MYNKTKRRIHNSHKKTMKNKKINGGEATTEQIENEMKYIMDIAKMSGIDSFKKAKMILSDNGENLEKYKINYVKKIRKYHPDKFEGKTYVPYTQQITTILNECYQLLGNNFQLDPFNKTLKDYSSITYWKIREDEFSDIAKNREKTRDEIKNRQKDAKKAADIKVDEEKGIRKRDKEIDSKERKERKELAEKERRSRERQAKEHEEIQLKKQKLKEREKEENRERVIKEREDKKKREEQEAQRLKNEKEKTKEKREREVQLKREQEINNEAKFYTDQEHATKRQVEALNKFLTKYKLSKPQLQQLIRDDRLGEYKKHINNRMDISP